MSSKTVIDFVSLTAVRCIDLALIYTYVGNNDHMLTYDVRHILLRRLQKILTIETLVLPFATGAF